MSDELNKELETEETTKKKKKEKAALTPEEKAKYTKISKILMIIGAVLTAVAPFLTLYTSTLNGENFISYKLKEGLMLKAASTPLSWLFIIPLAIAVITIILAIVDKKSSTKVLVGALGFLGVASMLTITMISVKAVLESTTAYLSLIGTTAEVDCSFKLGYYLMVVGYLLILGGAVSTKGLDSISNGDDEEESDDSDKKEEAESSEE